MTEDRPADVNERVAEEWVEDTTPGERVRSIMRRTYEPQSVATIADRALTTETTARKHLGILADDGFVEEISTPEERGTCYKRAPRSLVLERAQQILDSVDIDTLATRVAEMSDTVREFEERAGAESPRAAAVSDAELSADEVTEWQTTQRNLKIARAALALADATDAVGDDSVVGGDGKQTGLPG